MKFQDALIINEEYTKGAQLSTQTKMTMAMCWNLLAIASPGACDDVVLIDYNSATNAPEIRTIDNPHRK